MAEINQPTSMSGAQSCPTHLSLQLISLCDSSSDPWAIKDNQSRYLYGNDAYMALLNLKKGFNIKYLTDKQIPHDSAGSALYFEELDRKVQESKQHVFSLNIYPFGTEEIIHPISVRSLLFIVKMANVWVLFYMLKNCRFFLLYSISIRHYLM